MMYKKYIDWFDHYEDQLIEEFEKSGEKDWGQFVNQAFEDYKSN